MLPGPRGAGEDRGDGRRRRRHRVQLHEAAAGRESNARRLAAIETGEQIVVGVNKFTEAEPSPLATGEESIITVDPMAEQQQIDSLRTWRQSRDAGQVKEALAVLADALREGRNVMEPSIACAHAGVTTGEWSGLLREYLRRVPRSHRRQPGGGRG